MTEHFSLSELIASETARRLGIDNVPPADRLSDLRRLAEGLERIRALINAPIKVHSGYRSPALNAAVGGSKTSQHVRGQAADIVAPLFGDVDQLAKTIDRHAKDLGVDQVIKEKSGTKEWVHVSFSENPRHQALTIRNGKTLIGIV